MATYLGINVILYDQSQIYNEIGFSRFMSTIILPIINEFVNFIFTFPCHKTLLIVGTLIIKVFHIST
ncbi:hypothetical protein H8356DRAFT_1050201 [Neocallimastix lanati (nom. inval.)]|nr:hypothetical protein H8356DRAFT_1050201 [Neocallimastix sp. JGI-2020a]